MDPDQTAPVWVHAVCQKGTKTFQQMTEADDSCCDWPICSCEIRVDV